jgi:hypothetical protein
LAEVLKVNNRRRISRRVRRHRIERAVRFQRAVDLALYIALVVEPACRRSFDRAIAAAGEP